MAESRPSLLEMARREMVRNRDDFVAAVSRYARDVEGRIVGLPAQDMAAVGARDSQRSSMADLRTIPAWNVVKDDNIVAHGQSSKVLRVKFIIAVNSVHITASAERTREIFVLNYGADYQIIVSSKRIPDDIVYKSSAGVLVRGDYTLIKGCPCMVTYAKDTDTPGKSFHVVGFDLSTGKRQLDYYDPKELVQISAAPVGPFMPDVLSKCASTAVTAAALRPGYHIVIEEAACEIVAVGPKWDDWGRIEVFGKVRFTNGAKKMEIWHTDLVTVGRDFIDAGAWSFS